MLSLLLDWQRKWKKAFWKHCFYYFNNLCRKHSNYNLLARNNCQLVSSWSSYSRPNASMLFLSPGEHSALESFNSFSPEFGVWLVDKEACLLHDRRALIGFTMNSTVTLERSHLGQKGCLPNQSYLLLKTDSWTHTWIISAIVLSLCIVFLPVTSKKWWHPISYFSESKNNNNRKGFVGL